MTVSPLDVRATITCSLGAPVISVSISDQFSPGSGFVTYSGECVLHGIINATIGSGITFSWSNSYGSGTIPRAVIITGIAKDPLRNTTTLSLSDRLSANQNLAEPVQWTPEDDPQNCPDPGESMPDTSKIAMPIYASSVLGQCLFSLGVAGGPVLQSRFTIEKFDFSSGYYNIASDLLISENYICYVSESGSLATTSAFSLGSGSSTSALTEADIIDFSSDPGNIYGLPNSYAVSYSPVTLKVEKIQSTGAEVKANSVDPATLPDGYDIVDTVTVTESDAAMTVLSGAPISWYYTDPETEEKRLVGFVSGDVASRKTITSTTNGYRAFSIIPSTGDIAVSSSSPTPNNTYRFPVTRTTTEEFLPYLNTSYGQQHLSYLASKSDTSPESILNQSLYLTSNGISVETFCGREAVAETKPTDKSLALDYATGGANSNAGSNANYSLTEEQRYEISGSGNGQVTFTMPYCDHDWFSETVCDPDQTADPSPDPNPEKLNWESTYNESPSESYYITYTPPTDTCTDCDYVSVFRHVPSTITLSKYDEWDRLIERTTKETYIGASTQSSYMIATLEHDYDPNLTIAGRGIFCVSAGEAVHEKVTKEFTTYKMSVTSLPAATKPKQSADGACPPVDTYTSNTKCYTKVPGISKTQAAAFGSAQMKLLASSANSINIQVPIHKLCPEPLSGFALQINGVMAAYTVAAATFTADSNGIVVGVEGWLAGGVGGTGTPWFPLFSETATLPALPPIITDPFGNQIVENIQPLPLFETTSYINFIVKSILVVSSKPYELNLPPTEILLNQRNIVTLQYVTVAISAKYLTLQVNEPTVGVAAPYFYPNALAVVQYESTVEDMTYLDPDYIRFVPGLFMTFSITKSYLNFTYPVLYDNIFSFPDKYYDPGNAYGWDSPYNTLRGQSGNGLMPIAPSRGSFTFGGGNTLVNYYNCCGQDDQGLLPIHNNKLTRTFRSYIFGSIDTPVINTDGTVSAQVGVFSVREKQVYSIAKYRGTGVKPTRIGHGLNEKPAFVMITAVETLGGPPSDPWWAYGSAWVGGDFIGQPPWQTTLGYRYGVGYNNNTYNSVWGPNYIGNTTVEIGAYYEVNDSSTDYLMYSFLDVPGITKIDSYIGDGNPVKLIECGFRPSVVIVFPIEELQDSGPCVDYNWYVADRMMPDIWSAYLVYRNEEEPTDSYSSWNKTQIFLGSNGFEVYYDINNENYCYGGTLNEVNIRYGFIAFAETSPQVKVNQPGAFDINIGAVEIRFGTSINVPVVNINCEGLGPVYVGYHNGPIVVVPGLASNISTGTVKSRTAILVNLTVFNLTAGVSDAGYVDPYWEYVAAAFTFVRVPSYYQSKTFIESKFNRYIYNWQYSALVPSVVPTSNAGKVLGAAAGITNGVALSWHTSPSITLPTGDTAGINSNFLGDPWCIDFWYRRKPSAYWYGDERIFVAQKRVISYNQGYEYLVFSKIANDETTSHLYVYMEGYCLPNSTLSGNLIFTVENFFTDYDWHHIAFERYQDNLYIYKDGNIFYTYSLPTGFRLLDISDGTIEYNSGPNYVHYKDTSMMIGSYDYTYDAAYEIDDFRVTKAARYKGSSYTVPTNAAPIPLNWSFKANNLNIPISDLGATLIKS